jgi:hypothetical protein
MTLQTCVGPLDHHQGIRCTSSSRIDEVYNMSVCFKITSNIYYLKNCFYFYFVSSTTTTTTTFSHVLVS